MDEENVSDDFDSEAGEDRAEEKNTFFLYGDLYKKLVEAGIPRHEIAFIHDTESSNAKKAELFNKVNAGEVRILIGSTAKMGAGTNVQERVVAIHHFDSEFPLFYIAHKKCFKLLLYNALKHFLNFFEFIRIYSNFLCYTTKKFPKMFRKNCHQITEIWVYQKNAL